MKVITFIDCQLEADSLWN